MTNADAVPRENAQRARVKRNGRASVRARFSARVGGMTPSGCLPWTGSAHPTGYGFLRINGRRVRAHRASWLLARGEIPPGAFVCHHCDNPQCVNVAHLYIGSPASNSADMVARNRSGKGSRHSGAKLTGAEVVAIREQWRGGATQYALAKKYGVTRSMVWRIVRRRAWTHIPEQTAAARAWVAANES